MLRSKLVGCNLNLQKKHRKINLSKGLNSTHWSIWVHHLLQRNDGEEQAPPHRKAETVPQPVLDVFRLYVGHLERLLQALASHPSSFYLVIITLVFTICIPFVKQGLVLWDTHDELVSRCCWCCCCGRSDVTSVLHSHCDWLMHLFAVWKFWEKKSASI